jgi:hypothetical protein
LVESVSRVAILSLSLLTSARVFRQPSVPKLYYSATPRVVELGIDQNPREAGCVWSKGSRRVDRYMLSYIMCDSDIQCYH